MNNEITINTMQMMPYELTIWQVKRAWRNKAYKYTGQGYATKFMMYPIEIDALITDMHKQNPNSIVQVRRIYNN